MKRKTTIHRILRKWCETIKREVKEIRKKSKYKYVKYVYAVNQANMVCVMWIFKFCFIWIGVMRLQKKNSILTRRGTRGRLHGHANWANFSFFVPHDIFANKTLLTHQKEKRYDTEK